MKVVWPGASLKIQLCPDADLTDLGLQALEILESLRLLAGVPQQGRRVVHGHLFYAVLPEELTVLLRDAEIRLDKLHGADAPQTHQNFRLHQLHLPPQIAAVV